METRAEAVRSFLTALLDVGGAVASWSVCSTPDQVVRVLAGDIVLCSW